MRKFTKVTIIVYGIFQLICFSFNPTYYLFTTTNIKYKQNK